MLSNFINTLSQVEWRQPAWLCLSLFPVVIWLLLSWRKSKQQQAFADHHLLPWLHVQQQQSIWQSLASTLFSRSSAYFIAWLFFAIALAGPRLADSSRKPPQQTILDVMLLVDVSQSMRADDIQPNRLRRATLEAYELLSMIKNARVGISVYAGRPHLFVPLTHDLNALKFYLQDLDSLALPTQGSDAAAAFDFARKALLTDQLNSNAKQSRKQVIVWMSDGDIETPQISSIETSLRQNNKSHIDSYILGIGTQEGAAIPLANGGWLEHQGQAVITSMKTRLLQSLSQLGHGKFSPVRDDDTDWKRLYQQGILASLSPNTDTQSDAPQQWQLLFGWFLFPAIVLILLAHFPFSWQKSATVGAIYLAFFTGLATTPETINAAELNFKVETLAGIESYKKRQFGQAKGRFIQAVLKAKNAQERAIALHNLGNALFQAGDFASAAEVFSDALRYAPQQAATLKNQQLSIAIYTELEKQRKRRFDRGNFAAPNDNAPLFEMPEQIPFMLSTKAVNLLKASLPKIPEAELKRLLAEDLKRVKLMQGSAKNPQQTQLKQDIEQARIHFMGLEEKQSTALWKRLFEIEEGFPGKLKKPKPIPGVRPW